MHLEFSLVAPLLLLTTLLILDAGFFFYVRHTLQLATREGVRLALVGATLTDDTGAPMTREATIIDTIERNAAVAGLNAADLRISIYPIVDASGNPEGWEERQDAGRPGDVMRVRVRYDHPFITPIVRPSGSEARLVVMAEATYRNELLE